MPTLASPRRRWRVVFAAAALSSSAAAQSSPRPEAGLTRLEAQLAELAKTAGGTVGAAVVHLESGRAAYLNRGVAFPLASAVKVATAVQVLTRVDRGELRLDSMIALRPVDLHPGGTLADMFASPGATQPGVALSVRNLLEVMFRVSDNSAADVLLRAAGGPAAVNERLAALGVAGVRADRSTVRVMADYGGVKGVQSDEVTAIEFARLSRAATDDDRAVGLAAYLADPRDTATPEGMAALLEKISRRQAVSAASSALLVGMMYRCATGPERIKGLLPQGTRVAHKTGTLAPPGEHAVGGRVVNDVGIVDLPGGGHLVVAAFVKNASDDARAERAIAHIARAAYDYFTLAAP